MNPKDQVYWHTLPRSEQKQLTKSLKTDVVIVGGGMAGLTCAQACLEKGLSVVVLEAGFIGCGASGKSSGFITPDSELQLSDLLDTYGPKATKELWEFVSSGCEAIRKNILDFKFDCDYQVQDCLFVANSESACKKPREEDKARKQLGYDSRHYDKNSLSKTIGTNKYFAGVRYGNTFGINSYSYCQELKQILLSQGVQIFENSAVENFEDHSAFTAQGKVFAKHLVFCADWFLPSLGLLRKDVFHAQTFLGLSSPLNKQQVKTIFPEKPLMVWDTDLIYQYYRLTGDNRLLFGGSSLFYTYAQEKHKPELIAKKFYGYLTEKFPDLKIEFEYLWPGLIGVSKDFLPLAGAHHKLKNTYYIAGSAGLPWAAALGKYMADKVDSGRSDLDHYFTMQRGFPISQTLQRFLRKKVTFMLSHGRVKYLK